MGRTEFILFTKSMGSFRVELMPARLFVFPRLEMLATGLVCVFMLLFLGELLNHAS